MSKLYIFDFDGTITDAEVEGTPFTLEALRRLARYINRDFAHVLVVHELLVKMEQEEGTINNEAWEFDGHKVAPAGVDPYLRFKAMAWKIVEKMLDDDEIRNRKLNKQAIQTFCFDIYRDCYEKSGICFRDGAYKLLTLFPPEEMAIVTNSGTAAVKNKLRKLMEAHGLGDLNPWISRTYGEAKKYIVEPEWETVDWMIEIRNQPFPTLLRRKHYYERLNALRGERAWEDLVVVGDIFALDLALPLHLGATVILTSNDYTPRWELPFLNHHPRGHVADSLEEVISIIETLD